MKILITGARGMLGSHISKLVQDRGIETLAPLRQDLDLLDAVAVRSYLSKHRPTHVIHCAAIVGGILENVAHPTRFITSNLILDTNVIESAFQNCVENFLYISSSCVYPRNYKQPLREDYIFGGKLEPTNKSYAVAKLAGMQQIEAIATEFGLNYRTVIPSNLYGPGDNFDSQSSHLVAAALKKVHDAKIKGAPVLILGSGKPRREFTYVEDLANWISLNLENFSEFPTHLNLGLGVDFTVLEYYEVAAKVVGFEGPFSLDLSKPDGMKQKLLDSTFAKSSFNWNPTTTIQVGMERAYKWWQTK